MQRSGSHSAENVVKKHTSTQFEGEYFNFGEGKAGRTHADLLNITLDEIQRHGAQWWYRKVFGMLEQNMTDFPCAVGFRVSERVGEYGSNDFMFPHVAFDYDELKPLLEDRAVKKIILERRDTKAQWFSMQRACWFREWSDHHNNDSYMSQKKMTMDHVRKGEFCGPKAVANFTLYKQTKYNMYRRWYAYLNSTSQSYLAIKTEDLDKLDADPSQLHEFIFPRSEAGRVPEEASAAGDIPRAAPVQESEPELPKCESCSRMGRTISELKHMVEEHAEELLKPAGELPELPNTRDTRAGMTNIHFALLPGYQVLGKTSINLSELPWAYQCGIESAVLTGSKVTFWYRGFPEGNVHDDITDGQVEVKLHSFQRGTQTGDWWFKHTVDENLTCPNAEVTVSDYIRQDLLQRFGGVYMDLDLIILDNRLPHGPDGLPAQRANDVWKDQALVGNYLKYSPESRFGQCMFDMWKLHWDAYVNHTAECAGRCQSSDEGRDLNKQWGYMGPSLVTHAYLSCKDETVSVYPPSAFGNDPWPCNQNLVENDKFPLLGKAYALHTCHELAFAMEELGGKMQRNTSMGNIMQERCPKTKMRMYSGKTARKEGVAQNLMGYLRRS
jgi:hypothetical protein